MRVGEMKKSVLGDFWAEKKMFLERGKIVLLVPKLLSSLLQKNEEHRSNFFSSKYFLI